MHTQSQVAGLQLQDVNPAYLDSLVLDYLAAEDFVEVWQIFNSQPSPSVSCTGTTRADASLTDVVLSGRQRRS